MKNRQTITAIIYDRKGNVLSIGQNSYIKTHPLQAKHAEQVGEPHKVFLHAEIAAIVRCKDLSKAYRIQVIRTAKSGVRCAKPCKVCMSAIRATPIQVIEHS